jgi:hypothetical protein
MKQEVEYVVELGRRRKHFYLRQNGKDRMNKHFALVWIMKKEVENVVELGRRRKHLYLKKKNGKNRM